MPFKQFSDSTFDAAFREDLVRLLGSRRDVRHFRTDSVDPDCVQRLLQNAMLAPSVGFSQPWRWVLVNDPGIRSFIAADHERAKAEAGSLYDGERLDKYNGLRLAGLRSAPVHIAVFADTGTESGHGLGRQTMPETLIWSVMMAIYALWLSATSEGLGVGWVSILDPIAVSAKLEVPKDWSFVAYLCLGWPESHLDKPLLELQGWETRLVSNSLVYSR